VVAPRAGAWIETAHLINYNVNHRSRPARARGLKQPANVVVTVPILVAPRAGAWIET